jgi:hypothetical protein
LIVNIIGYKFTDYFGLLYGFLCNNMRKKYEMRNEEGRRASAEPKHTEKRREEEDLRLNRRERGRRKGFGRTEACREKGDGFCLLMGE